MQWLTGNPKTKPPVHHWNTPVKDKQTRSHNLNPAAKLPRWLGGTAKNGPNVGRVSAVYIAKCSFLTTVKHSKIISQVVKEARPPSDKVSQTSTRKEPHLEIGTNLESERVKRGCAANGAKTFEGSTSLKRKPDGDIKQASKRVKLNGTPVSPPKGLKNYMRGCFLNAPVQCLVGVPELTERYAPFAGKRIPKVVEMAAAFPGMERKGKVSRKLHDQRRAVVSEFESRRDEM